MRTSRWGDQRIDAKDGNGISGEQMQTKRERRKTVEGERVETQYLLELFQKLSIQNYRFRRPTMAKLVIIEDDGTQKDITNAVLSSTQPREPAQETANRSTVTTADRADTFHSNVDVQAKANQSLRDKLDETYAMQVAELAKVNVTESRSLADVHDRRRNNSGTYDKASDHTKLMMTQRDYSDAEDDENRRQNIDAAMARQTALSAFNQDDVVTIALAKILAGDDAEQAAAATLLLKRMHG
jgi:hypothetical protein